ncbi:MAG: hypothetical protein COA78_06920 [Blastopirellula sp.]|nr:MAG: hypothetical protein COA78_06920 [Blastopirellula sp.]
MNKYQNSRTNEVKSYEQLRSESGADSFPKSGRPILVGEWNLLAKGTKPDNPDFYIQGIREIVPVDGVRQWELYDLVGEEKAARDAEHELVKGDLAENAFVEETNAIKAGYTANEVSMFQDLKEEAIEWTANNLADTVMIDAVILESGEDKAVYIAGILSKVVAFKRESGKALGKKRKKLMA